MNLVYLVVLVVPHLTTASPGDRTKWYTDCMKKCGRESCNESHLSFPIYSFPFSSLPCSLKCRAECIEHTVPLMREHWGRIYQFHGKWPFRRICLGFSQSRHHKCLDESILIFIISIYKAREWVNLSDVCDALKRKVSIGRIHLGIEIGVHPSPVTNISAPSWCFRAQSEVAAQNPLWPRFVQLKEGPEIRLYCCIWSNHFLVTLCCPIHQLGAIKENICWIW